MKTATVYLSDGTHYQTSINGTKYEIEQYFFDRWFNVGNGEHDLMKKCVRVDVSDENL